MEDILEHIDEDVEIPDDDDEEDLEDTDMITDTIPMLKEKIEPEDQDAPINVVTTSPNGHSSEMPISDQFSGSLPKLPPLPPIPPPLLNLEFLKLSNLLYMFIYFSVEIHFFLVYL